MQRKNGQLRLGKHLTVLVALVVFFVSLWGFPTPSFAHDRSHKKHKFHKHHGKVVKHGDEHFKVPRHIQHRHRHNYRPYFLGRVYFPSHRHYHRVYRFPVEAEGHLVFHPYVYCRGEIFLEGFVHFPRILFGFKIGDFEVAVEHYSKHFHGDDDDYDDDYDDDDYDDDYDDD